MPAFSFTASRSLPRRFFSRVAFNSFISNNACSNPATWLRRFGAEEGEVMAQKMFEPASEVEAEMAAVANACLMKALDHSKAETIRVTVQFDDGQGDCPELQLPPRALRFFADVLRQMATREPMLLVPQQTELTTQEAAAMLNVSRPFVIKEIEAGRIPCRLVNRHRRILFVDLMRYQQEQKQRSAQALADVSRISREIGQEL